MSSFDQFYTTPRDSFLKETLSVKKPMIPKDDNIARNIDSHQCPKCGV